MIPFIDEMNGKVIMAAKVSHTAANRKFVKPNKKDVCNILKSANGSAQFFKNRSIQSFGNVLALSMFVFYGIMLLFLYIKYRKNCKAINNDNAHTSIHSMQKLLPITAYDLLLRLDKRQHDKTLAMCKKHRLSQYSKKIYLLTTNVGQVALDYLRRIFCTGIFFIVFAVNCASYIGSIISLCCLILSIFLEIWYWVYLYQSQKIMFREKLCLDIVQLAIEHGLSDDDYVTEYLDQKWRETQYHYNVRFLDNAYASWNAYNKLSFFKYVDKIQERYKPKYAGATYYMLHTFSVTTVKFIAYRPFIFTASQSLSTPILLTVLSLLILGMWLTFSILKIKLSYDRDVEVLLTIKSFELAIGNGSQDLISIPSAIKDSASVSDNKNTVLISMLRDIKNPIDIINIYRRRKDALQSQIARNQLLFNNVTWVTGILVMAIDVVAQMCLSASSNSYMLIISSITLLIVAICIITSITTGVAFNHYNSIFLSHSEAIAYGPTNDLLRNIISSSAILKNLSLEQIITNLDHENLTKLCHMTNRLIFHQVEAIGKITDTIITMSFFTVTLTGYILCYIPPYTSLGIIIDLALCTIAIYFIVTAAIDTYQDIASSRQHLYDKISECTQNAKNHPHAQVEDIKTANIISDGMASTATTVISGVDNIAII